MEKVEHIFSSMQEHYLLTWRLILKLGTLILKPELAVPIRFSLNCDICEAWRVTLCDKAVVFFSLVR